MAGPWIAQAIGVDLTAADEYQLLIGGSARTVRFAPVQLLLPPPDGDLTRAVEWQCDVGFFDRWEPPWAAVLGQVGFFDHFTVMMSRMTMAVALEAADGHATVVLQAGRRHSNPMGTVHGGILCDIADAAMGIAFASTLAAGESFTTVELKINFFRPVRDAMLRAEGRVIHRGRTIGYVECNITDETEKLIAKSNSTCLVLRGDQATGR